ncbi:MAG: winged helix DNA-binding protein [Cytophagales bacterium]|nr:winged helix DNA-binding protein [Cytophagales bacterium]
MKLEEEIKQKKFKSEWKKATINIIYTGNWLTDIIVAHLKPYKITEQHFNILRILRGKHPNVSFPSEIKEVLINKKGDLTRLLDKLVKMELVHRDVNAENRRMVNISITQKGLDLLSELDDAFNTEEIIKEKLSEKETEQLNVLLDKLRG